MKFMINRSTLSKLKQSQRLSRAFDVHKVPQFHRKPFPQLDVLFFRNQPSLRFPDQMIVHQEVDRLPRFGGSNQADENLIGIFRCAPIEGIEDLEVVAQIILLRMKTDGSAALCLKVAR